MSTLGELPDTAVPVPGSDEFPNADDKDLLRHHLALFLSPTEHAQMLSTIRNAISGFTAKGVRVDALQQRAMGLQPLSVRLSQQKLPPGGAGRGATLVAKAICAFTSAEVTIQEGHELVVLDASNQDLWKVLFGRHCNI